MRFLTTSVDGVFIVEPEPTHDERGLFARTFCAREFEEHGLNAALAQCSISFNREKGTLRGMHYQAPPHAEAKLVRCTAGAIFDVAVDLRPSSPTFRLWTGVELTAQNRRMLYVPEGCAHGFQTLCDATEVFYQISEFFRPEYGCGVRWDDPAIGIRWPAAEHRIISAKDLAYPLIGQ